MYLFPALQKHKHCWGYKNVKKKSYFNQLINLLIFNLLRKYFCCILLKNPNECHKFSCVTNFSLMG